MNIPTIFKSKDKNPEKRREENGIRSDTMKLIGLTMRGNLLKSDVDKLIARCKAFYDKYGYTKDSHDRLDKLEKMKVFAK